MASCCKGPPGAARAALVRLVSCERGATAPIFAITLSFVLFTVGIAIDLGITTNAKIRQQMALDAAALAASDKLGLPDQDERGRDTAEAYYMANTREHTRGTLEDITLDAGAGEVRAVAGASVFMSLLNGLGIRKIDIGTGTRILKGKNTVELALVLDNSGSMSGDLATLKSAASNLLGIVFAGAEGTEKVKVGLVPFAASVNVGSHLAGASWLDADAEAPIHSEDFSESRSRFTLFDQLGVAWGGCVMTRPAPHNVRDTPAVAAQPETMFVPLFAPDEPDPGNRAGQSYYNNYLVDDGGVCPPQPQTCTGGYSRRGNCRGWTKDPLDPAVAQARVCKYQSQTPSGGTGPNYGCTSAPILPLTSTRSDVETAIEAMQASGNTNIAEGTMWGWRVLSADAPFTEGRSKDDEENSKFLIVMTDGANFLSSSSNINKSVYAAYGYAAKGRLGNTYTQAAYTNHLNAQTLAACANAKADGITIFTIAFRLENDATTQALLGACATSSSHALKASDGNALVKAFENIGREISQLRVAG